MKNAFSTWMVKACGAAGVAAPAGDGTCWSSVNFTQLSGATAVVVSKTTRFGAAGNRFLSQSVVSLIDTGAVDSATARVAATLAWNAAGACGSICRRRRSVAAGNTG